MSTTLPTSRDLAPPARAQMGEAMTNAATLGALAAAALEVNNVDGHHFVMVPPGYSAQDISTLVEKAQPKPDRKRGTVQLKDVASLLAYCADQAASEIAYIYADPDKRSVTAIFNDQRGADAPGWRDHRAEFKAEYTAEFQNWLTSNKKVMTQSEFAEFIEDNLADLGADSTKLLDVATTLQAKTDINFASAKHLQNGQVQLAYTETINATAGVGGALEIPKLFTLGLRIFKNGDGYKLSARLKYRLHAGGVKFWYELDRPERSVEDAFAGYVNTLREQSGYTVLIGTP